MRSLKGNIITDWKKAPATDAKLRYPDEVASRKRLIGSKIYEHEVFLEHPFGRKQTTLGVIMLSYCK